jgi:DNA-binding NarL/FixJ family response regulator
MHGGHCAFRSRRDAVGEMSRPRTFSPGPTPWSPRSPTSRDPLPMAGSNVQTSERVEIAVLALIANGHSNAEVARMLVISEETVRTSVRKLQAHDRVDAVASGFHPG